MVFGGRPSSLAAHIAVVKKSAPESQVLCTREFKSRPVQRFSACIACILTRSVHCAHNMDMQGYIMHDTCVYRYQKGIRPHVQCVVRACSAFLSCSGVVSAILLHTWTTVISARDSSLTSREESLKKHTSRFLFKRSKLKTSIFFLSTSKELKNHFLRL